jgi:hypothetical protein
VSAFGQCFAFRSGGETGNQHRDPAGQDQQAAALKGKRPFDLAVSDYFHGKNLLLDPSERKEDLC